MAKKSKAAINFEYGALRFFCALVNAIPYPLAMSAAKGIAAFAFDILGPSGTSTPGASASIFVVSSIMLLFDVRTSTPLEISAKPL